MVAVPLILGHLCSLENSKSDGLAHEGRIPELRVTMPTFATEPKFLPAHGIL
jgi:hypothetical protein